MANQVSREEITEQRFFMGKVASITHVFEHIPLAYVHTYGCQQNVSDGEKLKGMLEKMGYGFTDKSDNADLVLFNTCAVRENAEDKVFGNIGELKHFKSRNPDMVIAVCGCMVQQEHIAKRLKQCFPYVDIIFGTHVLHTFPQLLFGVLQSGGRVIEIPDSDGIIAEGVPLHRESGFRASVPIMYGCNNFCTYCVVPYVRGRERSRNADEIENEVKGLVADGYRDILLLGQNVNSYGKELGVSFSALLKRLDLLDGDFRISFMTSHPKDCTKELIDTIADSKHISYHLHLPVQSGSNRILKLMNRGYTAEHYLELVGYAKSRIEDISLTTDIIVGFPDERYEDFTQTLDLMRKVRFDSAFTFIFSPRKGTKAAEMPDPVTAEEKGKWFRELLEVQGSLGGTSYEKYVGRTMRVLCEGEGRTDAKYFTGKSRQNIIVDFDGDATMTGKFVNVKITKALSWALIGEVEKS